MEIDGRNHKLNNKHNRNKIEMEWGEKRFMRIQK